MTIPQENSGNSQEYENLLIKVLTGSIYKESAWALVQKTPLRNTKNPLSWCRLMLKNILIGLLAKQSVVLLKTNAFDEIARDEGTDWPFLCYTMAGHRRLENVRDCIEQVMKLKIDGDFVETGAWRGGTTIFMRAMLKLHGDTTRKVWVADSFEGLPPPKNNKDGWDLSNNEYLKVSREVVEDNFRRFGLLDDRVMFLKGWFCDTLPTAPIQNIAILRLDGDMYSSTMDALTNLYDKVSPGGFVIVDDYHTWPACKRAVDEFLAARSETPVFQRIDQAATYWQV